MRLLAPTAPKLSIFSEQFWADLWQAMRTKVLGAAGEIIFIIVLFAVARLVLFKVIDRVIQSVLVIDKLEQQQARAARVRTLAGLAKSVTGYVLFLIAALMVLQAVNVDPRPLLTAAGVVGFAAAFGAQKLIRDVISGFFIILENQYAVGDYVTVAGFTGVVEEVGMRMTRIRDDVGKLCIVSNGDITTVTNHSRGAISSALDVGVAPGTDIARAEAVLNEVGREAAEGRKDILSPFRFEGVVGMDATRVTLRLRGKIDPRSQEDILMELRERIRSRFQEEGITIA